MNYEGVLIFLHVAQAGSLSEAARRLKIKPMAATRRLASLEEELGVRLIQRTTRSASLTVEGKQFLPYAATIVEAAEAGQASLQAPREGATGLLRVTACGSIGRAIIMPLLPELIDKHPGLRVDLQLTDTLIDIVSSGIDVGIRIGELKDSNLIASPLGENKRLLCAAPSYVEKRGLAATLDELLQHECILPSGGFHWVFTDGNSEKTVNVSGRISVSNMDGVMDACVAGNGIAMLSSWHADDALRAGKLLEIKFADFYPRSVPIWAVYPTRRQLLPKVEVFIQSMKERLSNV